ncbi:hypothetical protein CPC08DRAFT_718506 [Agrocybe pediades]|nr:hypothetical protein CPC08DRAFT_718506 [Agrocybe pediades]
MVGALVILWLPSFVWALSVTRQFIGRRCFVCIFFVGFMLDNSYRWGGFRVHCVQWFARDARNAAASFYYAVVQLNEQNLCLGFTVPERGHEAIGDKLILGTVGFESQTALNSHLSEHRIAGPDGALCIYAGDLHRWAKLLSNLAQLRVNAKLVQRRPALWHSTYQKKATGVAWAKEEANKKVSCSLPAQ